MDDTTDRERRGGPPGTWVGLAAAAGVGAGLVHAAAAGTHAGDATVVRLFAVAAVVQVALGLALASRPTGRVVRAGLLANLGALAAWALSRTVGIDLVAGLAEREAVGVQDLVAAGLEVVAVVAAGLALASRPGSRPAPAALRGWLPALVVLPVLVGVTAEHAHGDHDHHHDVGTMAAADGHDHAPAPASGLAVDPVFAGADTSTASDDELAVAKDLVEQTRAGVAGRFSDEASVLAAGYTSIGDGRRVGGYEHFVNVAYLGDGSELDPSRIESLVFERTATGKRLVSAMYVLGPGKTMADVPELAGDLTAWHDHQNLCWDASGTRLSGVVVDGRCVPSGIRRATSPMLHVWLEAHECGPFAGIEAHGDAAAGCDHSH
ncbi:MAG: hypothetical protein AB7H43_09280 [Acidimicrobiia bacterium]